MTEPSEPHPPTEDNQRRIDERSEGQPRQRLCMPESKADGAHDARERPADQNPHQGVKVLIHLTAPPHQSSSLPLHIQHLAQLVHNLDEVGGIGHDLINVLVRLRNLIHPRLTMAVLNALHCHG